MKLRAAVRIVPVGDGAVLYDEQTGLRLELSRDAGNLLAAMATGQSSDTSPETLSFVESLASIGLLDTTPSEEAIRRQARYVIEQAASDQRARVRATVQRAVATTRLHAGMHAAALADPSWQVEHLRPLSRADLRRQFPDGLACADVDLRALLACGDVVVATTSGTSGERLQVFSDTRIPRLPPGVSELWNLSGLEGDAPIRTAVFTSAVCSGTLCTTGHKPRSERVVQEHTLLLESPRDAFSITRSEVERCVAELEDFRPDLLYGNPIYLRMLAARAEQYGLRLPRPRALVLSYQLASSALRRSLRRLYAAPVFEMYAATELGGSQIGISCSHDQLHVRLDHVYVELVDARGLVEPGELGEVVVTTHNPVIPLVRYALRDLARYALTPCRCPVGSSWPSLVLEGRVRDAFVCKGRYVTPLRVDDALSEIGLEIYQLCEVRPGEFELAVVGESNENPEPALEALLQPRSLTIRSVDQLALDPSQKFRFCVPYVE